MFLINYDVDNLLISYVLNGTEKWNFNMIKRLYIIFGKSQFTSFIMNAKKFYFNQLFKQYKVATIDDLLKILLKTKNPHFYEEHIKFRRNTNSKYINFEDMNKRHAILIKYFALYNNYIWLISNRFNCEGRGNVYTDIHDNPKYTNKPLKYSFMKAKGIHNLEYYDLINRADNIYDSTYKLKPDAPIYKLGATSSIVDIFCIKMNFYTDNLLCLIDLIS
jgi:hypothetical protein